MRQLNQLFLACTGVLSILCSGNALAHAHPDRFFPAPGSVLHQPPAAVSLHFDTQLEPVFSTLKVIDGKGRQVSAGQGKVDQVVANVLNTRLARLEKGDYQVQWIAVAHDGHRTRGNYRFTVL